MTRILFLTLVFLFIEPSYADVSTPRPPDWISHRVCTRDSREDGERYCLEVVELEYSGRRKPEGAALLIPGLFQNGFVFDLLPEHEISFARQLMAKQNLKIYFLHVRAIGQSDYPKKSNLDDIAIDDISLGIRFVSKRENKKIIVIGHSQGAITLQASLAGLTRCGEVNCFNKAVSSRRQEYVKSAILYAGNVAMTTESPKCRLALLSRFGVWSQRAIRFFVDTISAPLLTDYLSPTRSILPGIPTGKLSLAYSRVWEFLYHIPNVNKSVRQALYDKSLDHSTTRILEQFARGVVEKGITNSAGERYADYLKNISIPVTQITFSRDPLAEPNPTYNDSFDKIGTKNKKFHVIRGQGHEDFLMNRAFFSEQMSILSSSF